MPARVFICYARVDQAFALPLAEHLKARGVDVWVDQEQNKISDDWDRDIDRALRECSHLLIVLSPASVDSREVRGELRTALDLGKPVLPVLYKPCEIPRQLRIVQFVDFTKRSARDASALNEVLQGLSPVLHGEPASSLGSTAPMAPRPEPSPTPTQTTTPTPPEWRSGRSGLSPRAKLVLQVGVVLILGGAAWYGLGSIVNTIVAPSLAYG